MNTLFVSRERIPLAGTVRQKFLDVNENEFFWDIHIHKKIGEGRSCLCYDVEVEKGPLNRQKMILKQFYPELGSDEISASLSGTELTIDYYEKRPDIQLLAKRFQEAFVLQNKLASAVDQVVKPSVNYFAGTTMLVLYEANSGEGLDRFLKEHPENLLEMLNVTAETAEALYSLHQAGYLHMDLKPENILWNHKRVKLFDFDASISLDDRTSIYSISHDGRKEREQTLAPELRNHGDKRPLLTPRADIYSLGCILFEYIMGRCPSDDEIFSPESFKDEFHEKIHGVYDDEFSFKQQEQIFGILSKSINYDMSLRYESAKDMAEEIQKICAQVESYQKKRMKPADNNLLAAYLLNSHPIYQYKYMRDGRFRVDVSILGNSAICAEFIKNIFACAQMLDTELNIRVWSPNAKSWLEKFLKDCPQLKDTTNIYLNSDEEKYIDVPLNKKITMEPFANLYFYEKELELDTVSECIHPASRYFIIADEAIPKNKLLAEKLTAYFEKNTDNRVFIGYGKRGNGGIHVRNDMMGKRNGLKIQAFCCDANITKDEKTFKTDIYRMALGIHTFYTKEWNEKAERLKIKNDLFKKDEWGDFYNLKSSVRCALSIKYKYDSCNIPLNLDNAKVFFEKVLLRNTESAEELYQKIVHLEHQSWMCFMIMEGYRRPTEKELQEYFFKDGHDHRNKKKKLHPCISASSIKTEDLDELDKMSLKLHEMAEERTKKIHLDKNLCDLEEQLEYLEQKEELLSLKRALGNAGRQMLNGKRESHALWDKIYESMAEILHELDARDALHVLKRLNSEMRVVKERNLFHDYKLSDATIIHAIPRLVMDAKEEYKRILKTPSKNMNDMVISTLLMEPEELILLTDMKEDVASAKENVIQLFLKNRGLGDVQVTHSSLEEIRVSKNRKKTALDITGCNEKYMMKLFREGLLSKLPVIRCEDGKVLPEQHADDVRYYLQPRHLSEEETLALFNEVAPERWKE